MKNNVNKRSGGLFYNVLYFIIQILILAIVALGILYLRKLNVENIMHYTPDNTFFASITILFLYVLKSITIVIPLIILYVSSSLLFPTSGALLINSVGIILCMSIPYFIGKLSGEKFTSTIINKYPRAEKFYQINKKKEFITVFTIKIVGIMPNDISSLLIGSMNISYKKFIIAATLAKSPIMIIVTLMSSQEIPPKSPEFILIVVLLAVIVCITSFINRRYFTNKNGY